jgi:hypothetical protein
MDPPKFVLEQKPRQRHSILRGDELSRLWNASISHNESLAYEVIHDLRDAHASLRDGVFLF